MGTRTIVVIGFVQAINIDDYLNGSIQNPNMGYPFGTSAL